jgi:predicted membrane protein
MLFRHFFIGIESHGNGDFDQQWALLRLLLIWACGMAVVSGVGAGANVFFLAFDGFWGN